MNRETCTIVDKPPYYSTDSWDNPNHVSKIIFQNKLELKRHQAGSLLFLEDALSYKIAIKQTYTLIISMIFIKMLCF